jgi:transposase-like protein
LTTAGKGRPAVTRARQVIAIQLSARNYSLSQIGRLLAVNHSSIYHLLKTAPAREREMAQASVQRQAERQNKLIELRKQPVDYTAWDEWI